MRRIFLLRLQLILLAASSVSFAQTTSQLMGTITDASGGVVAEARVTAVSEETGSRRDASSNAQGLYTIPALLPGRYRLEVEKQGFKAVTRGGIVLEVNQVARVDVAMTLGAVSERVEVTAAPPLVDSASSSLGQVIEQKAIVDLPLNGRNFVQLAILGPGVSGVGYGSNGTIMNGSRPADLRPGSELFSNGNREGSNDFLMDGVDNNVRLNFAISLRPSVEAVREFKIQTNMFAAEQGRNAGATINVITKSGSNQLHGSAYEFLRNSDVDARNYFADASQPKPIFQQNQFGSSLGGPVKRNKLFFFLNYEGFRQRLANTFVNTVPIAAERTGDFSAVRDIFDPATVRPSPGTSSGYTRDPFPGRQIPAARFDSVDGRLIQAYPLPQRSGLANNQTTNPKTAQRWDLGDARLDYNLSPANQLFGRFSIQNTETIKPSTFAPTVIPGMSIPVSLGDESTFAGDSYLKNYQGVINWTHTFSPSLLLEGQMGYTRFNLNYTQDGASLGAQLGEKLGVRGSNQGPDSDGIPIFSPSGYTGIGQTRSLPILRIENTFHPTIAVTKITGRHTLKAGFEARRRQMSEFQTNQGNGRFNFDRNFTANPNQAGSTGDAIASFLLGTASTIQQDFLLVWAGIRGTETGSFVQDDWRVTDRLTLNIGLRYEFDTPFSEVRNRWANFDVYNGKMLIAGYNSDANVGVRADGNNFAPRFGFAYQLKPHTVIRGGYGIFYNTQGTGGVVLRLERQLPFGPVNTATIDQFSAAPLRVQDGLSPIPPLDFKSVTSDPNGSLLSVAPGFINGYAQQYNLQLQQELAHDIVVKAGYVANLSRHLDWDYNYNQPNPGPGSPISRRPLGVLAPDVVSADLALSDGSGNYHAFQATAEKRYSSGLNFMTGYTFSHSIDNVPNAFGGAVNGPIPQDPRNRKGDRGTSGFDIQQRFTHSMNYLLPVGAGRKVNLAKGLTDTILGGWQVNTILTMQTGLPFTPTLASPVSNAGASRPDRLKSGTISNPGPAHWFDTSFNTPGAAWATPLQYTYGDSGRNPLRGPGRVNLDFSLFKQFAIRERWKLQFRAEFFNLFNTPQFDLPNATIGNPAAGVISSIVGTPRQIQFALHLAF
jgi:hypothetical protein